MVLHAIRNGMHDLSEKSSGLRGIAALFDDTERKQLFRKYIYFLCWVELGILLTCWLYQIGGSEDSAFSWRLYFLIAFLAPIAITFVLGTVVVGFNKYFSEPEHTVSENADSETAEGIGNGRIHQLSRVINLIQRLPFLALLLLLGLGTAFFYKLGTVTAILGGIGDKSIKVLLATLLILLLTASFFALVLIILNYRLRKTAMEYQYKTEVAEKLGLVILKDNTVLNSSGRLLLNGAKIKTRPLELLPEGTGESKDADVQSSEASLAESVSSAADLEQNH
jgi:hypothetical protein